MKIFISILTLFVFQYSIAQKGALKKPLTKADLAVLDIQLKECVGYDVNVNFTFNTRDLYDNKYLTGDTANNISQVLALKKQLQGNYRDAVIYNNMGMVYKGLFMQDEAIASFAKALELGSVYVKNHPDSSSVHDLLGAIYSNQGKLTEAVASFEKAYGLDKTDSIARFMIPICYIFAGNFDEAIVSLDKLFSKPTDEFDHCSILTMVNYMKKMTALQQLDPAYIELTLKGKSPEELTDLTRIGDAYKRNKNNKDSVWFEFLYLFNRHLAVCVKSFMRTIADPKFNYKDIKFRTEQKDIAELNQFETFYKKCLADTVIANKYILYKSLGNIQLLKGNVKAALPFLVTAIKLKPVEKSKYDNNAAEDYDNLAAAYFMLHDTLNYEKTIKEKFAVRPAVNPLPLDYATMAKIAFFHRDYAAAQKFSEEGLKMDPSLTDAHICLIAIDILNRNIKDAYKKIDNLYAVNPKNYALYVLQGICLLHDNDASNAYSSFNMAKDLGNDQKWIDKEILGRFFTANQ